jgi:hypothetical protein
LGEGRDGDNKEGSKGISIVRGDPDGEKGGFMIVNEQPCSQLKLVKGVFGSKDSFRSSTEKDESVVSVLEDRSRHIIKDGMNNSRPGGGELEHT